MSLGTFINRLFNEYRFVRRVLVVWALVMITLLIFKLLDIMTVIDTPTAAVVGTIVGILATVTTFYIKSRELDAKREHERDLGDDS